MFICTIQRIYGMRLILTKILLHKNFVNKINVNYGNQNLWYGTSQLFPIQFWGKIDSF